ncbi:MAG: family 10 glycosylhydrolase [Eubacterium sp.]|jgi:uncharacterized lipoprotein YddW (UPF0748 family)|nr:family 10 glycosylhydrolase [Eubacterium sp.]
MEGRKRSFIRLLLLGTVLFCGMSAVMVRNGTVYAKEVRAVWVSFYEYEGAGLKNKGEGEFRQNADQMFRNIRDNGCNTVYFHVRAFDDAIWPSDNFDFSSYMGDDTPSYDPLAILIEAAHKYKLSFHAWMNPYRITQKKIYDPSEESTTSRILLAVREVIDNYGVDGIHFDDYFYPSKGHKQYSKYSSLSVKKKKSYTNAMVQTVYNTVKQKSDSLSFGISPAGNVEYCESIGADVKTWMSEPGYVDYIIPQIYWSNVYMLGGKKTKLFDQRLLQWRQLNTAGVEMYIGLGLYRGGMKDSSDLGWGRSSKVVASEISKTRRSSGVSGYSLFSYESLYKKACQKEVKNMLSRISTVKIKAASGRKMKRGQRVKLTASVWPIRLGQSVTWKSSNRKIATISKRGVVRAKKKGTVKMYAKKGSRKAVIRIQVVS